MNLGQTAAHHQEEALGQEQNPCLSVVMPCFNEEATLRNIIEKVLQVPYLLEVVVVDDCSQDATPALLAEVSRTFPQVRSIRHQRNQGKTAALKTGFAATRGDIVIVQDADLEYDPDDIPEVIRPILQNKADVVYGSRFLVRRASRVFYFYHYVANKSLTFFSNLFTNFNMTDVETGYKAFRGDIIRNMIISSSGFGFEIEVTAKVAKLKARVYEVPISYYGRTYEEGKKIGLTDAFLALWYIFKYNVLVSSARSFRTPPETLVSAKS